MLEAFDKHPVDTAVKFSDQVAYIELGQLLKLAHERETLVRRDHDFEGARLAMAVRVLAGMVDVELVVRMLDHRHAQSVQLEHGDQAFDEGGLARPRIAGKADDFHAGWAPGPSSITVRRDVGLDLPSASAGSGCHPLGKFLDADKARWPLRLVAQRLDDGLGKLDR